MHPVKDNEGDDVATRIGRIITDWMGRPIDPTAYLVKDVGLDSLDQIDLAMRLEEEFGIEIPDGDWEGAADKRICDLTDIVMAKLAAKEVA